MLSLVNGLIPAGEQTVTMNAENVPGGIYILKMVYGNKSINQKMLLLR